MAKVGKSLSAQNFVVTPVFHNAEYFFESTEQFIRYTADKANLGRYGRYDNPNWSDVERQLAALDGAEAALLFPSGMNALTSVLLTFVQRGEEVLFLNRTYRNTRALFDEVLVRLGLSSRALDQAEPEAFRRQFAEAYGESCRMVVIEMPSNPHQYLIDLDFVRAAVRPDTLVVVDSTFSTPVNLKPLSHGADLVVHSCTKYLAGHGDVMAGSVAGTAGHMERLRRVRDVTGAIPGPNAAFLLNRGLETLTMRMAHFEAVGAEVARWLNGHPQVARVYYTGLPDHPHHALAQKYLSGHGGVVAFDLKATGAETSRFVDSLAVPYMGTNFGSSHPLVEQCAVFTYYRMTPEERESMGISDQLVRLSVGFASAGALIEDIGQALARTPFGGFDGRPTYGRGVAYAE